MGYARSRVIERVNYLLTLIVNGEKAEISLSEYFIL